MTNTSDICQNLQTEAKRGQSPAPGDQQYAESDRRVTRRRGAAAIESPLLKKSNPTIKDLMDVITANHNQTTETLRNISQRMDDLEASLDFGHSKITENKAAIDELKAENNDLRRLVDDLSNDLKSTRDDLDSIRMRQENSERRSREWGIRIHGVPERPRENTRLVVCKIITDNELVGITSLDEASAAIEHCHCLGPLDKNKTRTIIANLYSRPRRNQILKDSRELNNQDNDIYITEDLTRGDHRLKMQARAQMKKAHEEGKKVVFRRGKLIINSKTVPIQSGAT